MGNNQSSCCFASPAEKYEVPILPAQQDGAPKATDDNLKSVPKPGETAAGATGTDGGASSVNIASATAGTFATTDPNLVAPELAPEMGLPYQFHHCGPPLPPCDDMRLRTINALKTAGSVKMDADAIDAPPDPEIASILKLVQSIFEAPAALVALFDDRRIFIRDAEGAFKRGDFPWRWSFCGWTMASRNDQIMVIPDALKDARFCNNEMVRGGPGVRFYCGTPLIASNGHRIGTLCFADVKPREFDASRCVVLNNLAELVVRHLEKDIALQLRAHDNNSLAAAYGNLRRTLDCFDHCVALVDTSAAGWRILFVNNPACKMLGIERESLQGSFLSRLLADVDGSMLPTDTHEKAAAQGREFQVNSRLTREVTEELDEKEKSTALVTKEHRYLLTFRPASREDLDEGTLSIGVPSFIPTNAKLLEGTAGDSGSLASATSSVGAAQRRPDRLYFMLMQDAVKLEAERAAAKAKAEAEAKVAAASMLTPGGSSNATSSAFSTDRDLQQPPESINGLSMGHLLGKGAYGSVYHGTWYGTSVAVKIIDEELPSGAESIAPPIEAILSKELRHPHIVATLRCARRIINPSGSSHGVSSTTGRLSRAALTGGGVTMTSGGNHSRGGFSDDTARTASTLDNTSAAGVAAGGSCVQPHTAVAGNAQPSDGWLADEMPRSSPNGTAAPVVAAAKKQSGGSDGTAASGFTAAGTSGAMTGSGSGSGIGASTAAESMAGDSSHVTNSAKAGSELSVNASANAPEKRRADISLAAGGSLAEGKAAHLRSASAAAPHGPEGTAVAAAPAEPAERTSAEDSEEYDDFNCAGGDSNMSPFMMAPGSAPPQDSAPRGGPGRGGSEHWPHDEVLVRHQTWLIMEYCDRGCLQDAVDRGWLRVSSALESSGPRMDAVLATAVELASALAFLHSKDIVHGDMSAWNIMLCTSGATATVGGRGFVAKIADFGLARHLDIRTKIETRTYGTLTHMPPEALRDGVMSKATDVYSLGVLLWQLYTSSRPWAGLRHGQIIVMVVTQRARLRFPDGTPPAYEALALACMEHDPKKRPAIEAVLAELEVMRNDWVTTS
ncbi:hypothetical protein CHLRE_10g436100v5 [Chlamydomonas reinhardtii]|uniref:Protein kinase domain-containing protein n=1 Tax=Chlamydomonas reinhardtii TaxID=3055 RepID=A0A2K3DA68_CHLRE|nr:uncharacterized protein CHLRE_10g436100v5 [Chlamydomonas reinhardtii]PNW77428.1 hypothetical protein CHLRE_10g436100v5 [Chlamydomonas reinhardtii]